MSEQTKLDTEDITADVAAFLSRTLERGEEHTVVLPDLQVIATDGLLKALRHIRDFDGCHPYEYDTEDEAKQFAVRSLHVFKGFRPHSQALIETEKGPIASDADALRRYRFMRPVEQRCQPNEDEVGLEKLLSDTAFLVNQSAENLVGYRHDLFVSTADPLKHPVSAPRYSEYGRAEAVLHTPVRALSVYSDEEGRKWATLTISRYASDGSRRQLRPVPLEQLSFEVTAKADIRQASLERLLKLSVDGILDSVEARLLIHEFNRTGADDRAMMFYVETAYPNERAITGMIGIVTDGRISGVRPPTKQEVNTAYQPDEVVLEPRSGQLYLVDHTRQVALSAADVVLDDRTSVEDKLRWRSY